MASTQSTLLKFFMCSRFSEFDSKKETETEQFLVKKKYKIKLKRIALTTLISYMCIEVKYGLSYGITMKIIEKIKQTRALLT